MNTENKSNDKTKAKKRLTSKQNFEKKEEEFIEIQLAEDSRIDNAQHALFERLDDDSKTDAFRWSHIYKNLFEKNPK